jgi:osmotically-inducible protein OsmY
MMPVPKSLLMHACHALLIAALALSPAMAASAAAGADGAAVRRMENATITAILSARLARDERTRTSSVLVETRGQGEVELHGVAADAAARRAASDIAHGVPGVRRVHNHLRLDDSPPQFRQPSEPPPSHGHAGAATHPPGSDLGARVRSVLAADRSIGALAIEVHAHADVVVLRGAIDCGALRARVIELAAGVPGVRRVDGRTLRVRG